MKSPRYAWYVVTVLMLAYVSSFVDRQILALLVRPIKRDFGLSDTQVSLLMGLSFALFYTLLGIPIGRLADTRNRRGIIALGITLWSLMTALCGLANTYVHLFLARMGVGVGEAALTPAAYSMISDYFPKERLSFALSVYSMGIYIGSGLSLVIAGLTLQLVSVQEVWTLPLVGTIFPWQLVFFVVGLPGLLIALLIRLTVREPKRKELDVHAGQDVAVVSFGEVRRYIGANLNSFLSISLGMAFIGMAGYGATAWVPSAFERVFGWSQAKTGLSYGLVITVFSTAGIITGGRLGDRYRRRGWTDAPLRVGMIAGLGLLLSSPLFPLMPTAELALLGLIPTAFFISFAQGAAAAGIQQMMPNRMRGLASAVFFFILNLIALGFGPTSVALLTDYVFGDEKMVRYSILIVCATGGGLAFLSQYLGRNAYRKSLEYLENYQRKAGIPTT